MDFFGAGLCCRIMYLANWHSTYLQSYNVGCEYDEQAGNSEREYYSLLIIIGTKGALRRPMTDDDHSHSSPLQKPLNELIKPQMITGRPPMN